MKTKRLLSVILTLIMVLTLLPVTASAANDGDVSGLRGAGASGGTYNLSADITIEDTETQGGHTAGLVVQQDLTIDLKGKNLTITLDADTGKASNGIKIASGVTLTIMDSQYNAGVSTNTLTVTNGAAANTTSGNGAAINTTNGTLIIESGTVEANGGLWAASIGGGVDGAGGAITIRGGTVNAESKSSGAGIGGGGGRGAGGVISISGGTVTAEGGSYGAGIGGSSGGAGGTINISGTANVTATGGTGGAGIGGGNESAGGDITISGGTVTAIGGDGDSTTTRAAGGGAGIGGGGGYYYNGSTTNAPDSGNIIISGDANVTATGGDGDGNSTYKGNAGAGIGTGGTAEGGTAGAVSGPGNGISITTSVPVTATGGTGADGMKAGAAIGTGGDQYGAGSNDYTISVSDAGELIAALGNILDGGTIKLLNHISLDSQITLSGKEVTLDLNGCTLVIDRVGQTAISMTDAFIAMTNTGGGAGALIVDGDIKAAGSFDAGAGLGAGTMLGGSGTVEVVVNGDIIVETDDNAIGVMAGDGATVTINGDIKVTSNSGGVGVMAAGVMAEDGAEVTIYGDIIVETDVNAAGVMAAGVFANSGAEVTIEGTITVNGSAPMVITFNGTAEAAINGPSGKPNYFEYTDGTTSYVWVRDPSTVIAPTAIKLNQTPDSAGKTVSVGYAAFDESEFSVEGNPVEGFGSDNAPVIRKISGDSRIIYRNARLEIPVGLPAGTYTVVLEAKNAAGKVTFTYTLTVTGGGYVPPTYKKHEAYLTGYPDGTVLPDGNITRAETAAILFRLTEDDNKNAPLTSGFSDVKAGAWYYQAVAYLEKHGMITGYPDGTLRPENEITRAEFAAIVSRFGELEAGASNAFPDVPYTHWAASYINSAAANGWVTGYPDGTFRPEDSITRAEVVTILNRMLDRKIELSDIPAGANKFTDIGSGHWAYCDIIEASIGHEYTRRANGYELWR